MRTEDVLFASLTAPSQGITITASASIGSALFWVRYEGALGSGASIAVNAGGDMAFTTDGTTVDTTVVASTGIIDLSTPAAGYDTLGEVVDVINGSANWSCVILAGLRQSLTNGVLIAVTEVDLSTAAYKASGYYFFQDAAIASETAVYTVAFAISAFDPSNYTKGDDPDVNCQSTLTYAIATVNATGGTGLFQIWTASQETETLVLSVLLADNTATTFGNMASPIWRSKVGQRLVIRAVNDQDGVANATKIIAAGYSIDLSGRNNPCNSYEITNT